MKFELYNNNPIKNKTCDCVIRAISGALNKSWLNVYNDLVDLARFRYDMPNNKKLYQDYLKDYKMIVEKARKGHKRIRVEEFKTGTYILSIANHLTFVKDGILKDTFDCRKKTVYRYWIIDETKEELK